MSETAGGDLDAVGLPADRPRTVGRRILSGLFSYGIVVLALWYLLTNLKSGSYSSATALITCRCSSRRARSAWSTS